MTHQAYFTGCAPRDEPSPRTVILRFFEAERALGNFTGCWRSATWWLPMTDSRDVRFVVFDYATQEEADMEAMILKLRWRWQP